MVVCRRLGSAVCLLVLCFASGRSQLQRAESARKAPFQDPPPVLVVLQREDMAGLLDLATVAAEVIEATAGSQQSASRKGAVAGRSASTRHVQRHHAPPSSQEPQYQKIRRLVAAAQQRVLQQLPPAAAVEAQQQWDSAAEAATSSSAPPDDLAAFNTQRSVTAVAGARPLVVSPDWIANCWEEARRLPVDSAHGRIEVLYCCCSRCCMGMGTSARECL